MSTFDGDPSKFRKWETRTQPILKTHVNTTSPHNALAAILTSLTDAALTWAEEVTPRQFFRPKMTTQNAIDYFFEHIKVFFEDPEEMKNARQGLAAIRSYGENWTEFIIKFDRL